LVCLAKAKLIVFDCKELLKSKEGSSTVRYLRSIDLSGPEYSSVISATTTLGFPENLSCYYGENAVLVSSATKVIRVKIDNDD